MTQRCHTPNAFSVFSILVGTALLSHTGHAAFSVEAMPNAEDRSFERLPDLDVIRAARLPIKKVQVSATAGEAWSTSINYTAGGNATGWIELTPAQGASDAIVHVRIDNAQLVGDGPYAATIVFTPDAGEPVNIDVSISIWPGAAQTLTRQELSHPDNWPSDSGYNGMWELWGFLPSSVSHEPDSATDPAVGANVDTWEKTPCPEGGPYTDNCTRPKQAGLASGQSADSAWLLSTGDPQVKIAVLDSGIKWTERDLWTKFALNADELASCPPPGAIAGQLPSFDVNGDGVFNIRDYDGSQYTDVNGSGVLDPQDLIRGENPQTHTPCSDSIDDDANGYVDDICGWDFFWNDNDAADDTDFGHGTGEAKDSLAEGNNMLDGIGVCPQCMLLPVRVGDSFVCDSNQFGDGVIFAVDSGAKVVQEALGTVNSTRFMRDAIEYAYANGVTVVASAADEASYHHNFPGSAEHTLYVHAIVYDNDGEDGHEYKKASTFLNFGNCTNYGGHLVLSTPGSGCSSEATGKTSGQAGLLHSYFLQLRESTNDPYYASDLSTEESYQLLIQSADDIDVPTDNHMPELEGKTCNVNADCAPPWYHCYSGLDTSDETHQTFVKECRSTKYLSAPGWDEHFGYGRNNARRSLEALRDKRIPPEADITKPLWFEVVDPSTTPVLDIFGSVASPRYNDIDWQLEWAVGVAPTDDAFQSIASGSVTQGSHLHNAKLGSLQTSSIFADPAAVAVGRDDFTVTLRLVATVSQGSDPIIGMFRKTIAVHHDADLKPGWPKYIGCGPGSAKITDLDGDGSNELIVVPEDGSVHAYKADGSELPGFPTNVNVYPGLDDAVCAATPNKCHKNSAAYVNNAIDAATVHSSVHAAPAIGDLDGNGVGKNIVVATLDGLIWVFDDQGAPVDGFPVSLDPAHTADFDWGLYQYSEQRFAEFGVFGAPVLADLDQDGDLEIVAAGMDQYVYAWHHDGSTVNGWPVLCRNDDYEAGTDNGQRLDGRIISTPVLADLDGNGAPEIVVGSNERVNGSTNSFIYALWPDGNAHEGGAYVGNWPMRLTGFIPDEILPFVGRGLPNAAVAADFDNDGKDEIIAAGLGGNMTKLGIDGPDGINIWMLPSSDYYGRYSNTKEIVTLPLINDPSIADLNLDGRLDVINGTAGTGLVRMASEGGRRAEYDHSVSAWDIETGYFLDGFPRVVKDFQFFANYAVADIDGDGLPETISGDGGYFVHAFNHRGDSPAGWPKFTSQWVLSSPAIGDLDGDGMLDVFVGTRDGWMFLWGTKGPAVAAHGSKVPSVQWSSFHHDDANTGNYGTPLPFTIAPAPKDDGCGCTCAQTQQTPQHLITSAFFAAMMCLRRHRQRRRY